MNTSKSENIILIILAALLFAGALLLYQKHSRPDLEITVIENGVKEELTLKEVEEHLIENRRIDINTATAEEITVIPGIGDVLAERIIAYRIKNGSFEMIEELLEVEGIGEKKLEAMREYIKIE
jgi:competence protein ComEA